MKAGASSCYGFTSVLHPTSADARGTAHDEHSYDGSEHEVAGALKLAQQEDALQRGDDARPREDDGEGHDEAELLVGDEPERVAHAPHDARGERGQHHLRCIYMCMQMCSWYTEDFPTPFSQFRGRRCVANPSKLARN